MKKILLLFTIILLMTGCSSSSTETDDSSGSENDLISTVKSADNIVTNTNYLNGTDYRYNGPDVDNYITFNGETWRIIGVVNGYVKIMNVEGMYVYSWNATNQNDWNTSSLNEYLNGDYYDSLSNEAKTLIQSSTYNLGGISTTDISVDEIYSLENGTTVYGERPTVSEEINISLMYLSDYGYSMKTGTDYCDSTPNNYYGDECQVNGTWMYVGINEWLLNPYSDNNMFATYIVYEGNYADFMYANNFAEMIRPVLYLKENVTISSGEGTKDSPYTLVIS
ncbi:MAG: DUF6273 domain-containing protein [Mycoplasmatota bacterium]